MSDTAYCELKLHTVRVVRHLEKKEGEGKESKLEDKSAGKYARRHELVTRFPRLQRLIEALDRYRNTVSALSIIAGVSIWLIVKAAF